MAMRSTDIGGEAGVEPGQITNVPRRQIGVWDRTIDVV